MDYLNATDNQNSEIIELIENINADMRDPKHKSFSKTTYWNRGSKGQEEVIESLLETLQGIESIVLNIEKLLRKI